MERRVIERLRSIKDSGHGTLRIEVTKGMETQIIREYSEVTKKNP